MSNLLQFQRQNFGGGGGGGITATRWRLNFPDAPDVNYHWLYEIEFRTTVGGAQAAIDGTTGTASTNSELASYGVEQAFDELTGSGNGWSSTQNPGPNVHVEFEFNSTTSIAEVYIYSRGGVYEPTTIEVQYHDGADWVTLQSFSTPDAEWGDDPDEASSQISLKL